MTAHCATDVRRCVRVNTLRLRGPSVRHCGRRLIAPPRRTGYVVRAIRRRWWTGSALCARGALPTRLGHLAMHCAKYPAMQRPRHSCNNRGRYCAKALRSDHASQTALLAFANELATLAGGGFVEVQEKL